MAVHARYPAHAFPHDPRGIASSPVVVTAPDAPVFLAEHGCDGRQLAAAVAGNTVFSDVTCDNNDDSGRPGPTKRERVGGAGMIMDLEGQRALLPPMQLSVAPPAFPPAGDAQSRVLCSGAASTSGRAPVSKGLLSRLQRNAVEIDALVRIETERLRAGLREARRRHARAVLSAAERAAARRVRAAEPDLGRALARNAELDERLRRTVAEARAWQGVARSHEAAAAGLRATLDTLLQSSCATEGGDGDAEDARSCCFGQEVGGAEARCRARAACRSCGAADAIVLLLPCRHLCLCGGCDAGAEACPVCAATKNASLHVLLD